MEEGPFSKVSKVLMKLLKSLRDSVLGDGNVRGAMSVLRPGRAHREGQRLPGGQGSPGPGDRAGPGPDDELALTITPCPRAGRLLRGSPQESPWCMERDAQRGKCVKGWGGARETNAERDSMSMRKRR